MVATEAFLVIFVKLVDRIPLPQETESRRRGRPQLYRERLLIKASVFMVIRRLYSAYWSKSGYHGWWYGWKLHLVCTAAALRIPLSARLAAANQADHEIAPTLLYELPVAIRYILGDTHYIEDDMRLACELQDRCLIATKRGSYPHSDDGAPVRQLFHRLSSKAIEPFNGLFKNVFEWSGQVPVRGLARTQLISKGKPPALPGRRAKFDKSGSQVDPQNREPLKGDDREDLHDSVEQSSPHKMGVQVPSCVDTKVSQEGNLRPDST